MNILLFGGTSEGRILSAFLKDKGIDTLVSVTTSYGEELIEQSADLKVRTGALDEREMEELFPGFDLIIDATHPYALEVSENIRRASKNSGVRSIRLLRDKGEEEEVGSGVFEAVFDSIGEAAEYLKNSEGRIFISTGAKELKEYRVIPDYTERLVARVLPVQASRDIIKDLAIRHVIYAKGPFSYEENLKHFKDSAARYLVTKDSGRAGGFKEKTDAAASLGMSIVLIRRKTETEGFSLEEIKEVIANEYR